jgi:metal-sulfur cluster biosynthetic enzyme
MSPAEDRESLREEISARLEGIIDPCSVASGAPAGLVSMGLVREVYVEDRREGAHVRVTLCITEPGCLMGALFKLTAERELAQLAGVAEVDVRVDYGYVWGPEEMTDEYRRRLAEVRARRAAHMKALPLVRARERARSGTP